MPGVATCDISGSVCGGDGAAIVGTLIKATIKSTEVDQGGQFADDAGITSNGIEAFTEEDGTYTIALVQGGVFLLEIQAINLRKEITVPAATTAEMADLV